MTPETAVSRLPVAPPPPPAPLARWAAGPAARLTGLCFPLCLVQSGTPYRHRNVCLCHLASVQPCLSPLTLRQLNPRPRRQRCS